MAQMVFDGQFLQVLYDDRGGDTLLVTFNEMESFANGRNYWGETVARNLKLSCIGVMTKTKNWFPLIEMDSVAANMNNIAKGYRYVVNYGFSQGAYAALKYSLKISATHVLAFSPQWTIDPKVCGKFDLRFSTHFDERLHMGMEISRSDISGTVCIFVDPYEKEDFIHAKIIESQVGSECVIPCFNLGHGTVRAISSTHALAKIVDMCKMPNNGKSLMFDIIREQKKTVFAYYYALGQRTLRRRHLVVAKELFRKGRAMNPNHPYLAAWEKAVADASCEQRRLERR